MLKKYFCSFLLIVFVFSINLSPAFSKVKEKNVLVVGTSANFPPFEYFEKGKIAGFDIDLMKAIGKKLSMEVVFEDMEFNTLLIALSSGKIDIIAAGMTITEERKKQINFSQGYFSSKQVLIVKTDEKNIKDIESLKGKKVGVQLGTTGDIFVSNLKNVKNVKFDTGAMATMDLKNGKIDAVLIDEEVAKKLSANNSGVKIFEVPMVYEECGLALNKNEKELLGKINLALAGMKKSGELDKIKDKYFPNK